MKIFLLVLLLSVSGLAQNNVTKQDTLFYRNGFVEVGEVKLVKEKAIDFLKAKDGITYEIKKSDLLKISFSTGKELEFQVTEIQVPAKNDYPRYQNNDSDSNVCLTAGFTAGLVIVFLLVLGAIAS